MSDNKKKPGDDLDFENFDEFDAPPPPNQSFDDDYAFEDLPSAPPPQKGQASQAKDSFEDDEFADTVPAGPVPSTFDEFEDDVAPAAAQGGDEFEYDFDEPENPQPVEDPDADFGVGQDEVYDPDPDTEYAEEAGDPLDPEYEENEYQQDDGAGDSRSFIQKHWMNGVIAVVVLGLGFVGWNFVRPIIFPTSNAPAVATNQPMQPINPGPATQPPSGSPVIPGLPQQPSVAPTLPGMGEPPASSSVPSLEVNPGPDPVAPSPSPTLSLENVNEPMVAESLGGEAQERLAALEQEVAGLDIEALLDRIEELEIRISEMEAQPAPVTPQPMVQPPSKPEVVEDWSLKGVQGDVAWIEGPEDFLEVRRGSQIPDVGEVTDITRYEGDWLVITDAGVILQQ